MQVIIKRYSHLLGVLSLVLFGCGILGQLYWLLELFSHFRVYYALGLFVAAFGILGSERRRQGRRIAYVYFLVGAFILYRPVADSIVMPVPSSVGSKGVQLHLISFNILASNTNHDSVVKYLAESLDPSTNNIIFLTEVNAKWKESLLPLREKLPFTHWHNREDNFGLVAFSSLPIEDPKIKYLDSTDIPAVHFRVSPSQGTVIEIFGVHPFPPGGKILAAERNLYLANLKRELEKVANPVVVMGDFNLTPWSPYYDQFLGDAASRKLKDSALGFWTFGTWQSVMGLLRIPIDHIFVPLSWQVQDFHVGPDLGSDHLPIQATVNF